MVKKKIAIIPARKGSKRIPNKNIIDFYGKPLIAWTIEAALKTGIFDKIIVSTDCKEIAKISKDFGANIPFLRESSLADDFTPVSDVSLDCLVKCEENFEEIYQLMPNCPLRTSIDIISAANNFTENDHSFQISAFAFGWMNPWWSFYIDPEKIPRKMFPQTYEKRSQDLPKLYCPSGAIWIAKTDEFKKLKSFHTEKTQYHIMNWQSAIDIDDVEDLEMAKAIFEMSRKGNKKC